MMLVSVRLNNPGFFFHPKGYIILSIFYSIYESVSCMTATKPKMLDVKIRKSPFLIARLFTVVGVIAALLIPTASAGLTSPEWCWPMRWCVKASPISGR